MTSRRRSEFLIFLSRGSRSRQSSTAEGCRPDSRARPEGYIEGQNLAIEYRFAEERLPELAVDLVGRHVALIVASGSPPVVLAAKAATRRPPFRLSSARDRSCPARPARRRRHRTPCRKSGQRPHFAPLDRKHLMHRTCMAARYKCQSRELTQRGLVPSCFWSSGAIVPPADRSG